MVHFNKLYRLYFNDRKKQKMSQDKIQQNDLKRKGNLPRHIAIIMDGNGRWARKRGLPRVSGHKQAIKSVRDVVEACGQLEIEVLTLYTFSLENWKRPRAEVNALMGLLVRTIKNELDDLLRVRNKITHNRSNYSEEEMKDLILKLKEIKNRVFLIIQI